jgi:hypothetical protein
VVVGGNPDRSFSRASTLGGAGTHAILGVQAGEDIRTEPDLIRNQLLLASPRGRSILLWDGVGGDVKCADADNAITAFGPPGTFSVACGPLSWSGHGADSHSCCVQLSGEDLTGRYSWATLARATRSIPELRVLRPLALSRAPVPSLTLDSQGFLAVSLVGAQSKHCRRRGGQD